MARWIAFDEETTSLLRSNLVQGTRIETLRRGPVDYALARPTAVITVLPATEDGGAGIAVFRPARHAVTQVPATTPAPTARPATSTQRPQAEPAVKKPAAPAASPRASAPPPAAGRAGTRASGFLGLSDEPVFEEEEVVEEKKGWWRRLWEE
jgi:hypothetical protein